MTLAVVVVYFVAPHLWDSISILYLALVSNYALVLTLASAEQGSSAKTEARERAGEVPKQDVKSDGAGDGQTPESGC